MLRLLEVLRHHCPEARLYQASTSEMYGDNRSGELSEDSPFAPSSPYAAAKLLAHNTKIYRNHIIYFYLTAFFLIMNHLLEVLSLLQEKLLTK